MKITDWEKIVLVWVNALKLTDQRISDVSQLHDSNFFLNLIGYLGKKVEEKNYQGTGGVLKEVRSVLEDEFKGFTVVDGPWDNHETTLVTSLLLLLSAFKCHDLRTPLYDLSGETQLIIQSFIQKFISIHKVTPLEHISRQLLITSLSNLNPDDEESSSEVDLAEGNATPRRVLSPVRRMESPDVQRVAPARMKSLECQLELLSWDKEHLLEEIDVVKNDLSDMRAKYEAKAALVLKLENELFLLKNASVKLDGDDIKRSDPSTEISLLKSDVETMAYRLTSCNGDLDREQLRNAELSAKLRRAEEENISLTEKCGECDVKILSLQANIEDLEGVVASLKTTVKDQAELLSDSSFIAASPHPRDLSLNESAITGETMANVVEMKCTELEDELDKIKNELLLSQTKVSELEKLLDLRNKENLELASKIKEHEVEDVEKVARLQSELMERSAEIEELKEDNEFLAKSLVEKRKDVERLQSDYDRLKRREEHVCEELTTLQNLHESICTEKRTEQAEHEGAINQDLFQEITRLSDALEGKQVRLEEATALVDKIKRDLVERDGTREFLETENRSLRTKLSSAQAKMSELIKDLAELVGSKSPIRSPFILVNKISSHVSSLTSQIDQERKFNEKLEQELAAQRTEVEQNLATVGKVVAESSQFRDQSRALESELENLKGQHRVRGTELLALQQAVSMCEHEKAILQRRIDILSIEAEKCESFKSEVGRLKSFVYNLEMELSAEKIEHKRLKDKMEINEKLSVAFDSKLTSLQAELKSQYDKEVARAVDEYNEKITLMKRRMQRDKSHIKELSNELWETSDRYLLASQEADALRNQLRRTRAALELVASSKGPHREDIVPQSNPCLWTEEFRDDFDERVTVTRERWSRRGSAGGNSLWNDTGSRWPMEGEDEIFGEAFLEDLKAGIVSLPQQPPPPTRASCPPPIKSDDSGGGGERFGNDRQSLIPPEPKRKEQVAYCRPGPPTPSRNARLSLQSLDRVSHLRDPPLRESMSHSKRFSRLFNTISSKSKMAPAPSDAPAQPKRKGFFRKFTTSNRENVPPPWH